MQTHVAGTVVGWVGVVKTGACTWMLDRFWYYVTKQGYAVGQAVAQVRRDGELELGDDFVDDGANGFQCLPVDSPTVLWPAFEIPTSRERS